MRTNKSENEINERLRRIANVLLINASFTDNIGLLNGKMGIAIFFYKYARCTGNMIYDDFAGELIDEIYEEIKPDTGISFENGLTGIGWGIEYLSRNKFVQADTDEALAEIDKVLCSKLISPILSKNGNDLFGYGLYYTSRLKNLEINDNDVNCRKKKENLIFLVDECERILVQNQCKGFISMQTLNSFIWFLLEMHRMAIHPFKTEKVMQSLPGFIEFSTLSPFDVAGKIHLQFLTGLLLPHINNISTRDLLSKQLNKTKLEESTIESPEDVDSFIKSSWQQLVYGPYLKSGIEHGDSLYKIILVVNSEDNWKKRLDNLNMNSLGLNGLAGLGMGLLCSHGKNN